MFNNKLWQGLQKLANNSFDNDKWAFLQCLVYTNIEALHPTDLVVDACAMIFPPIGFLGSAVNMAAPSTWATTWLVITTATPYWNVHVPYINEVEKVLVHVIKLTNCVEYVRFVIF